MTVFIFNGAFLGFTLARIMYLNYQNFCSPSLPVGKGTGISECYWYDNFRIEKIGIVTHLGAILPAALLAVFQFVPVIRHKAILYHRIAGYVIFLLVIPSDVGAVMILPHAFGGDYTTQMAFGFLVIITTVSLVLAYINVKRLQIDQHRAWMLRAWTYFGTIVTPRILQITSVSVEKFWPAAQNYGAKSCGELLYEFFESPELHYKVYPACDPAHAQYAPDGWVAVKGDFNGNVAEIFQALALNFGMNCALAFFLHSLGVELYLWLTPREGNRLRQLSYELQLERGFANPGSAGLVVQKFGDADPWVPIERKEEESERKEAGSQST